MIAEYTWLIPFIPMMCFLIIGIIGKKTPEKGGYIAIAGALSAFIISAAVSYEYLTGDAFDAGEAITSEIEWFQIGTYTMHLGYYVDGLTCAMMLFSSFISTLIFIYSLGYMHDQGERKNRYYAEVSLFLTGMLGLIVSSNFLELFIFWEVMGLCSYLLIGFWSFRHHDGDAASANAASAAKKAFLVTRMGDVCLMGGLFILLNQFGSLDYTTMFATAELVAEADPDMLTLGLLLMFGGVIGKSAQFPLHDWLPDAMAGPTTVSSLIHAATMVKAGVYLVARAFPIYVMDGNVMLFVGIIGGVTAFIAATMALNNMNIKKVLAYSTISQLGYMILALGAGGYLWSLGYYELGALGFFAGCFHMINHAFFKALLFMGSGSVIHGTGTEDMRLMGGLFKKMKITATTMLFGCLAIAGIPIFSGFWSKDLVIDAAMAAFEHGTADGATWFIILWVLAVITAFMTAFYMFRMWFMTFMGEPRENAQHCHGESPKTMTMPLVILAIFALISGLFMFVGLADMLPLHEGMELVTLDGMEEGIELFKNPYTYLTLILAIVGIVIAYLMYVKKTINPGKFNKFGESWLYKALTKRWWFPDLYNQISWKLGYGVAKGVNYIDRQIVDGTVNGLSSAVVGGGDAISKVQTGHVQDYSSIVLLGVAVLSVVVLLIVAQLGGL
ncbi:MAG: NADH-quinone oxidoreductase subunit L [Thermoplasmata archaeon]|jgi:NADH-quinone oxidoreductase subunit L|nr:NADH-quinone oxidoreductase subunit L [Thermoplasmata archaeon]